MPGSFTSLSSSSRKRRDSGMATFPFPNSRTLEPSSFHNTEWLNNTTPLMQRSDRRNSPGCPSSPGSANRALLISIVSFSPRTLKQHGVLLSTGIRRVLPYSEIVQVCPHASFEARGGRTGLSDNRLAHLPARHLAFRGHAKRHRGLGTDVNAKLSNRSLPAFVHGSIPLASHAVKVNRMQWGNPLRATRAVKVPGQRTVKRCGESKVSRSVFVLPRHKG